jgi:Histidine acid phosphatase.
MTLNIAMVRTLMGFTWSLPGYTRGNIPPGSSLVFERWRDKQSGKRWLHVYFQAQSLDDLRHLQSVDQAHPLLREEWRTPDCRITEVGTLCPMASTLAKFGQQLDPTAITPISYAP